LLPLVFEEILINALKDTDQSLKIDLSFGLNGKSLLTEFEKPLI
jgi:hypothetical protein